MGNVFTDELTLKEGDLLSMLDLSEQMKEALNQEILEGNQVIVPQRNIQYKNWNDIGYIVRDPLTGRGRMRISENMNGGVTVEDPSLWREDDKKIFIEGCQIVSIIPEILAPDENSIYYRGDSINMTVQYDVIYECGDGSR